ncbi:hypothetical protein [Kitasatospora sp. NPDC006786]|uniref:hypothetical protein n=1 Tax=unclassified Kitasatospora TaxID=2633591 RepID=UPI0033ED21D2
MRARLLLTGLVLGATVLVGGAATAQAAPVPSQAGTSSAVVPGYWEVMGPFTKSMCIAMRDSYAGKAYCTSAGADYYLHIWVL